MHPGQYIQSGSHKPDIVERSLAELRYVARLFDLIGSADSVLVLHMSGAYDDRAATARRFAEVMPPETDVLRYLALENDERVWTIPEIVETANSLSIPAITDAFHYGLNPGGLTLEEALDLSLPTWEAHGDRPKLYFSSQDPEKQPGAHAYSVDLGDWRALMDPLRGREADVMVEAKGKENALVPLGIKL
jgi:UV DNA damage endonuclease